MERILNETILKRIRFLIKKNIEDNKDRENLYSVIKLYKVNKNIHLFNYIYELYNKLEDGKEILNKTQKKEILVFWEKVKKED